MKSACRRLLPVLCLALRLALPVHATGAGTPCNEVKQWHEGFVKAANRINTIGASELAVQL